MQFIVWRGMFSAKGSGFFGRQMNQVVQPQVVATFGRAKEFSVV